MARLRRLVLDVLKPHEPGITELSSRISDLEGIDGCDITVYEIDREVENIKISIEGADIDFLKVKETIDAVGGTIHSIDKAATGTRIIDEFSTHQDSNVQAKK